MNEAGNQFEKAVAFANFWDRVYLASDWIAAFLVCGCVAYLWVQFLFWGMK